MVTKTQFPLNSHHDIALVPLNIPTEYKIMEPPDHITMTKVNNKQLPHKTSEAPPPPLNA